jgi:hypothetical protein
MKMCVCAGAGATAMHVAPKVAHHVRPRVHHAAVHHVRPAVIAAAPTRILIDCAAPNIPLPEGEAAPAIVSAGTAVVPGTGPLTNGSAPATAVPGFGPGGFYGLPLVSVAAPAIVATPTPTGGTPGTGTTVPGTGGTPGTGGVTPGGGGPTIGPSVPAPVASPSAAGLLGAGAMTVLATRLRRG